MPYGGTDITLFRYWIREIIPQFLTSLCVLCAVIVISQLIRLSELLVTFGLTLENVLLPFLFVLVPFLSFTIPMALMFAVLLSFSRMSADGEFTGMLAAGYSLKKACVPVFLVSLFLYGVTTVCALYIEPWGHREKNAFYKRKAQTQLDNMIKVKMKSGVFLDNFLGYVLYAENISKDRSRLDNVLLAPGPTMKGQNFSLLAPSASVSGSVESGDLVMSFDYGVIYSTTFDTDEVSVVKFKRAQLDLLRLFQEQIFGSMDGRQDYRSLNPGPLRQYIKEMSQKSDPASRNKYLKSNYLFYQRFGTPFAIFFFAFFAVVLGIQDERRGKNHGYLGAILGIIVSYIIVMAFRNRAEAGVISAPLAVWVPNVLLVGFSVFLVYQKNRLPPSESTLDPKYIPLLRYFVKKR